ncbi:hypothetical protein acdb102_32170 [Acidothermaceae bacterium B102]|nr:hypothetical protein acdb102_32170 [Acidothermaceae bacterium B102]
MTPETIGTPPYLVIGPSGVARRFQVRVVTKNIGTAAAPPSSLFFYLQDGNDVEALPQRIVIPKLLPGHFKVTLVTVAGYKPPLGFAEAVAVADWRKKIKEFHENNNKRVSGEIAIVARTWDVTHFSTTQSLPSLTVTTLAMPDFHFQFTKYDASSEGFEYDAVGDVNGIAIETGTCNGNGSKTVTVSPAINAFLVIGAKLTTYGATVQLSKVPPYTVPVSCLGGAHINAPFGFQDLRTFVGLRLKPHMVPSAMTLSDSGTDSLEHLLFTWDFKARIHH